MTDTKRYPLPDDIRNDKTCKSYIHFHSGNESPLASDYCHYVRESNEQDADGLYYGEWIDITEKERTAARIKEKKKELEAIAKEQRALEQEIKRLSQELEENKDE